jgi:phage-related holin
MTTYSFPSTRLHVRQLVFSAVITALFYLFSYTIYKYMDMPKLWEQLKSLTPENYATSFGILIALRVLDSITAYFAVKREKRIAKAKGLPIQEWASHTFIEKLFIKMTFYVGLILGGWFMWKNNMGSWGLTFAFSACIYAEIVSLHENTTRAGINWPEGIKALISALNKAFKAFLKK